jgi:hypothetical protein
MLRNRSRLYLCGSVLVAALALLQPTPAARAEERVDCAAAPHLLWFRGETVVWAKTHEPVGEEIADRTFLLRSALYVTSGSGRKLERFRMVWPERNETVTGGVIHAGNDPAQPPMADGIVMVGAGADEGVPYVTPPLEPHEHGVARHCLTS